MKHPTHTKPHMVYTRFRKTDDVFVPQVPVVELPVAEVFVQTSKRSVAAGMVICLLFSSLFVSAGKQLGTLSYFSDTELSATNTIKAGEWDAPEIDTAAFSLMSEETLLIEEVPLDEGSVAGVQDEIVEEEEAPAEEPQTEAPVVEETATPPTEEEPVTEVPEEPSSEEPTIPEEAATPPTEIPTEVPTPEPTPDIVVDPTSESEPAPQSEQEVTSPPEG
jgi:hypothetical protein